MKPFDADLLENVDDEKRIELIESQVHYTVAKLCESFSQKPNREKLFTNLLTGQECTLPQKKFLQQAPETFVCQNLVWPLLTLLGYRYKIEGYIGVGKNPDFLTSNTSPPILGEVKPFGCYPKANREVVQYTKMTDYQFGLITDGLYWRFVEISPDAEGGKLEELATGDLRGEVADYLEREDYEYLDESIIGKVNGINTTPVSEFYRDFNVGSLNAPS